MFEIGEVNRKDLDVRLLLEELVFDETLIEDVTFVRLDDEEDRRSDNQRVRFGWVMVESNMPVTERKGNPWSATLWSKSGTGRITAGHAIVVKEHHVAAELRILTNAVCRRCANTFRSHIESGVGEESVLHENAVPETKSADVIVNIGGTFEECHTCTEYGERRITLKDSPCMIRN